jgi:hypothetical protein
MHQNRLRDNFEECVDDRPARQSLSTMQQGAKNGVRSKLRVPIEHVFGDQESRDGRRGSIENQAQARNDEVRNG